MSEPIEPTDEQVIEEVKTLVAFASSTLPHGYVDIHDSGEPEDPHLKLLMNTTFDVVIYSDGYVLIDGGEFTPLEIAQDILTLMAIFRHYEETGQV